MDRRVTHPLTVAVLAAWGATLHAGELPIDFDALPFTALPLFSSGPVVPDPDSVLTDEFRDLGVVFGEDGESAGVAVIQTTFGMGLTSRPNSVSALDAAGLIPGTPGQGANFGDTYLRFVEPGTESAAETDFIEFSLGDAGGDLDEFILRGFDVGGQLVFEDFVADTSRFTVTIRQPGIHRLEIDFLGLFGYSLDDLTFATPVPPECFLAVGSGVGDAVLDSGTFLFQTQLGTIDQSHAVLMDDTPWFVLPGVPSATLAGASGAGLHQPSSTSTDLPAFVAPDGTFALQIMMWNPVEVPQAPEQYSPVLHVLWGPDGSLQARAVGPGTIDIALVTQVGPSGETRFTVDFAIPGF